MIESSIENPLRFWTAVDDIEKIAIEIESIVRFWTCYYHCFCKKRYSFDDVNHDSIALEKVTLDFWQYRAAEIQDIFAERKWNLLVAVFINKMRVEINQKLDRI